MEEKRSIKMKNSKEKKMKMKMNENRKLKKTPKSSIILCTEN